MRRENRRVRIFSALEVANICGVVNQTTINWIRNGHLKAFTTPGGQYRIYAKDLAAFLDNRGMSASVEVLQVMMENANWDTLLIAADESVNVNLGAGIESSLPEYEIIQAFNWFEVGRKLIEEKPGFILLDTDMTGLDIVKFFQVVKEDPIFGKPIVFLYTHNQNADFTADGVLGKPLDLTKLKTLIKGFEKNINPGAATASA